MTLLAELLEFIGKDAVDPDEMSPLTLAYVGDAVYDLFIRSYLVLKERRRPHDLHISAVEFVAAKSQARTIHELSAVLDEAELEIVRRGRNAKPASPPKHAGFIEYRYSTGFEALLGYLYLTGKHDRLKEILFTSLRSVRGH